MLTPSKAKFSKLPVDRQHRWLAHLLSDGYKELSQWSRGTFERFYLDYAQYLTWMSQPCPTKPEGGQHAWREWISDQFHHHQKATQIGLGPEGFLEPAIEGDLMSDGPWVPKFPYWIALEKIRSAFNLGSILRTTDTLGFAGVLIGPDCPPVTHNQVRKTAMGAQSWIPVIQAADFWSEVAKLEQSGHCLIGVERCTQSVDHRSYPWPKQAVLFLGNEEFGLSTQALSSLSTFVHLPMFGRKNSLNIGCAYSALGFQITNALE